MFDGCYIPNFQYVANLTCTLCIFCQNTGLDSRRFSSLFIAIIGFASA